MHAAGMCCDLAAGSLFIFFGACGGECLTATEFLCWDLYNLCLCFAEMIRNESCLTQYQQTVKGTSVQV